jgi:hypothetical protein
VSIGTQLNIYDRVEVQRDLIFPPQYFGDLVELLEKGIDDQIISTKLESFSHVREQRRISRRLSDELCLKPAPAALEMSLKLGTAPPCGKPAGRPSAGSVSQSLVV